MSNYRNDNLLDKLRIFELTVAELYIAYASIFSEQCDSWTFFAEEEIQYAKWLSTLKVNCNSDIARGTRGHREKFEFWLDKVDNRKYLAA